MAAGTIAVLTGDVVRSSELDPAALRATIRGIENAVASFQAVYPDSVIGRADVYRGDSWQIAMREPRLSLRFALYLRALTRAGGETDTRVSVATGSGDDLLEEHVSQSTGETFTRSGRGLDAIGARRLALDLSGCGADVASLASVLAILLDGLASGWSAKQAASVCKVIENPGQPDAEIVGAGGSDSARRNFTKLKSRARMDEVLEVLEAFERLGIWGKHA